MSNQTNAFLANLIPLLFLSSTGAVSARNIMLLKKKQARCQGVVCAMKVSIQFEDLEFFFDCSPLSFVLQTQTFSFSSFFPFRNNFTFNLIHLWKFLVITWAV